MEKGESLMHICCECCRGVVKQKSIRISTTLQPANQAFDNGFHQDYVIARGGKTQHPRRPLSCHIRKSLRLYQVCSNTPVSPTSERRHHKADRLEEGEDMYMELCPMVLLWTQRVSQSMPSLLETRPVYMFKPMTMTSGEGCSTRK